MAGYIIANIHVTDPVRYATYTKTVGASIAQYGGRFLVRGGKAETLEGTVDAARVVVLEFPTVERAKAWWNSDEYREPKAIRLSAATADMLAVEGV